MAADRGGGALRGAGNLGYSAATTRCTRHCVSSARKRRRLDRLVEHLDAVGARLLAHVRAAVGGDQDGGEVGAEAVAQRGDGLDAVAVVEVIVDQEPIQATLGPP